MVRDSRRYEKLSQPCFSASLRRFVRGLLAVYESLQLLQTSLLPPLPTLLFFPAYRCLLSTIWENDH